MKFEVHLKELKQSQFVVYYENTNLDFPLCCCTQTSFEKLGDARRWCDWAENNGYKIKKVMMEVI